MNSQRQKNSSQHQKTCHDLLLVENTGRCTPTESHCVTLEISRHDRVINDEVLRMSKLEQLSNTVRTRRLAFARHIPRLPEERPLLWIRNSQWRPSNMLWAAFKEDLGAIKLTWREARE